jgi:hypothetical protein
MMKVLKRLLGLRAGIPGGSDGRIAFIVSAPRSGSTWLRTALNGHADLLCTELRLFGNFAELWSDNRDDAGPARLRITLDAYVEALSRHVHPRDAGIRRSIFRKEVTGGIAGLLRDYLLQGAGRRVLVDKVTPYPGTAVQVLEGIREFFPGSPLVLLVRDGRDVAVSAVFDWLKRTASGREPTATQRLRIRKFADGDDGVALNRFFEDSELEHWGGIWREVLLATESAADLVVTYEAMKRDQAAVLREVLGTLGVGFDDGTIGRAVEASSFRKMSGGRESGDAVATAKARKGVVGDWTSHFTRNDGEQFDHLCGAELQRLGYIADRDWWKALPQRLSI